LDAGEIGLAVGEGGAFEAECDVLCNELTGELRAGCRAVENGVLDDGDEEAEGSSVGAEVAPQFG
jgi:hypothetical protein